MDSEFDEDDDLDQPTPEELEQMRQATPGDAAAVDALILGRCTSRWLKVARIVGDTLDEFEARWPHLPYVYLSVRIAELVRSGALEAQGDVMAMRESEIRLPGERD